MYMVVIVDDMSMWNSALKPGWVNPHIQVKFVTLSRSLGQITGNQIIMFVAIIKSNDYKFSATFRAFINIRLSQ